MVRKIGFFILMEIFFLIQICVVAYAKNVNIDVNFLEEELNYKDIQDVIDDIDYNKINFEDEVKNVITEGKIDYKRFFEDISDKISSSIKEKKDIILKILIITIITTIFTNFSKTMENAYVAQTSFIIVYMVLMTYILNIFSKIYDVGYETISILKRFIEVFIPTYTVASFVGTGFSTATAFNQLIMIVIVIIESLFIKIVFPLINIYLILLIVNNICTVITINKITDLIKTLIRWSVRTTIFIIMTFGIIERLIAPTADNASRTIFEKGINIIPYIGNSVTGINETLVMSAKVIKNACGSVGIIMIIVICLMPIVNILIYIFLYEMIAALIEPISDNRVVKCVKAVSDGSKLLLEVVVTSMSLFIITIGLMAS